MRHVAHLEYVDVDVGHREHGSADQHAEQGAEGRREAGDVDQQPVLRVQTQSHHQDGPEHQHHRVSLEVSCENREAGTITPVRMK